MLHYAIIDSYEEKYAPPEDEVLKVSVVDDVAFLTIGKHSETGKTVSFEETSHITVPVLDLLRTVASEYVGYHERAERKARGDIS